MRFRNLSSAEPPGYPSGRFFSAHKFFYIYLITNVIDGRNYVGKHYGTADRKYMGSGKLLRADMRRLGRKNFRKDILSFYSSWEELSVMERRWIAYFKSMGKAEYNIAAPRVMRGRMRPSRRQRASASPRPRR